MGFSAEHISAILVVDDDLTSGLVLESILRKEGFTVWRAMNGGDGRAVAAERQPDLILLDINMPGEDGLQTCSKLKAEPGTSEIPVIFISSVEDVASKVKGFSVGGVDYITKPYHPAEVLARVRLHLRLQQAYRAAVAAQLAQIKPLAESQQMLLVHPDDLPGSNFGVAYIPLHQAGGDFYDVIRAGAGIYDYQVADIAGHDLGTVLATPVLKALIRQNVEMLFSPLENLHLLNRHLKPVLQEGQYATLIYVRHNQPRSMVTMINAGHPAAILLRDHAERIDQEGDMLGIFEKVTLEVRELPVAKGDRLFLFSDGLVEREDHGMISRRAGYEVLMRACEQTRGLPIQAAVDAMIQTVFPSRDQIHDDLVLLGFQV